MLKVDDIVRVTEGPLKGCKARLCVFSIVGNAALIEILDGPEAGKAYGSPLEWLEPYNGGDTPTQSPLSTAKPVTCPACGTSSPDNYVGFTTIECVNGSCCYSR